MVLCHVLLHPRDTQVDGIRRQNIQKNHGQHFHHFFIDLLINAKAKLLNGSWQIVE